MLDLSKPTDESARRARHWYATRWVALYPRYGQPLPHDLPISRKRLQAILFSAGAAEREESTHA